MASFRLLLLACAFVTCHAGAPLYNSHLPSVVPGEYLVNLKAGSVNLNANVLSHVTVLDSFHIGNWRALHVKVEEQYFGLLAEDENVDFLEANAHEFHALCEEQATGSTLWGLTRLSHEKPNYSTDNYWHLAEERGEDVSCYVIDTGIYLGHNDFEGRAVHGFTAPGQVGEGNDDLNGHGTLCAGIIGSTTYGVAKGTNLIAVKVLGRLGSGSTTDIVAGVNYVAGAHSPGAKSVMNLSLGMSGISPSLESAIEAAIAAGVNAVIAAGNSNADACNYSPARVGPALTVAASTNADLLASFTNYGICVDIVAPGNGILSTYIGSPDATSTMSGTSAACAYVAGWVARYLSTFSTAPTPAEVKAAMVSLGTHDQLTITSPKQDTPNVLPFAAC